MIYFYCLIVKDVCQAIVQILLLKYLQVPQGERLKTIIDGFHTEWVFHNVLEPLMAPTYPLSLQSSTQLTITTKKRLAFYYFAGCS